MIEIISAAIAFVYSQDSMGSRKYHYPTFADFQPDKKSLLNLYLRHLEVDAAKKTFQICWEL